MPTKCLAQTEITAGTAVVAVLQGILSYEGAQAWKRWNQIPNEDELQRKTVEEIASILGDKIDNLRFGQATSYFKNATRDLGYYSNNPAENMNSLNEARTQSGYALNEFAQMGPQSLHPYCITATLHMVILQEKIKSSNNPVAERKNIELHIGETKKFIKSAENAIIKQYKWNSDTLARKKPPVSITGSLQLPIESEPTRQERMEMKAREGVRMARLLVMAFDDPKTAFPLLQAEIERMEKAKTISPDLIKSLPATPLPMSPAATGSLAIPIDSK